MAKNRQGDSGDIDTILNSCKIFYQYDWQLKKVPHAKNTMKERRKGTQNPRRNNR